MPDPSQPQKEKMPKNKVIMICFYKADPAVDQTDSVELSDYITKMKKMYRYRDIPRRVEMEEEKLKKTEWCEPFKAKIAPQVCMLRRKYDTAGYCNRCKGTKKLLDPK